MPISTTSSCLSRLTLLTFWSRRSLKYINIFRTLMFSFPWDRRVRGRRRIISIPIITRIRIIITSSSSLITISSGRTPSFTWKSLILTGSSRRVSSTSVSWWISISNWSLTFPCITTLYLGNPFLC